MKVLTDVRKKVSGRLSLTRRPKADRLATRTVRRLRLEFRRQYHQNLNVLCRTAGRPDETAALLEVLLFLSSSQAEIDRLFQNGPVTAEAVRQFTSEAVANILDIFEHQHLPIGRAALADSLKALALAQANLPVQTERVEKEAHTKRIVIHAELLYQVYGTLFPAEKIAVASARKESDTSILTALFDVTGSARSTHVRAAPDRLAQALLAMEATDSFLLCWIHSHPGRGAGATYPSSIDRRQQEDWIKDYSKNLTGIIMVEDGHFRVWGSAIEQRKVDVVITGSGIQKLEEENVFRLVQ